MNIPNRFVTWSIASFRSQLQQRFNDCSFRDQRLKLFFEMDDYKVDNSITRLEVRLDGPYFAPQADLEATIELNILVVSTQEQKDLYFHMKQVDVALAIIKNDFFLKELGFPNSSGQMVGCYQINDKGVAVTHHGQIDPAVKLYQSSLEAHYEYAR